MALDTSKKALALDGIVERLEKSGLSGDYLKNIIVDINWQLERLDEHDNWGKRYLGNNGHLWKDDPSACGEFLLNELKEPSLILDLGCGYGRDSKALLEQGHYVLGVDKSKGAIIASKKELSDYIDEKKAFVTNGDFAETSFIKDNFDAVLSHRMLHLPDPDDARAIIDNIATALKPGGLLVLTARRHDDFNEDQMKWVNTNSSNDNGNTAVYKDRPQHKINFYDEDRFRSVLSEKFTDLSFEQGEEIESVGNFDKNGKPVMSQFLRVTARKKTEEEIQEDITQNTLEA
ncbi:MAG: hypothetical protein COA45_06730 [Zetaproteobacteria bacterium]|nr:MAG: hypothetical protein COA45_06730 [Zetaproteobacteria bacterium]